MAAKTTKWTPERVEALKESIRTLGSIKSAAKAHGVSEPVVRGVLHAAGVTAAQLISVPALDPVSPEAQLRDRVRELEAEVHSFKSNALTEERVRSEVLRLSAGATDHREPSWLLRTEKAKGSPGVPTILASDWHWGEVVDPSQIGGVNSYDLETARRRARTLIENAVDLLKRHMVNPSYPGIVLALGGDMLSGDIHEELTATNEVETMPALLDLYGTLTWCIETLAREFGNVFVPAVSGNHTRTTRKPRAKGRGFTSYDWLLYQFLAKRFEDDKRVQFKIPSGPDALYRVYGHRYLLTHGDQWRGGDGIIGAIGPIFRGDSKKRARNAQVGSEYDTLLCGHWHQQMQLRRLIVAGSLKGYDEYAHAGNFPFEPPQQPLWITHPDRGITFSIPVFVERTKAAAVGPWVSWAA